ncbi:hypothetical protein [Flavobacterium sp.]|uniref:hypothetical protein n=1 Tax=Flavobacterium sp. TaxID=239 RepID=UPI00286A31A5|nr:hypothetical protein [Flavobacterium sp.]
MKKLFTLLFIGIFTIGCSSDSSSDAGGNVLPETSSAKAEYNNSNFGIYKGVFTGSSGVMTVNVMNNGSLSATLKLDGITHNFTTSETVTQGQNTEALTFTSGEMSFDLDISANGGNVDVTTLSFPGHDDAALTLTKEYSYQVIKCYEGTHSGTSSGILNVIIDDDYVSGLSYTPDDNPDDDDVAYLNGSINGTAISGTFGEGQDGGTFTGTVSGNTISGTWQSNDDSNPASGTWTCQRTL